MKEEGEEVDQDEEEKEEKQPRVQAQQKKFDPAFGRRDMNTNNEVINDQENPADEMGDEGNEVNGQKDGTQGSGNPVHNLSSEFLEDVLKQQKAEGN